MPHDGDAPEESRKRAGEGEGAKPAPKAGKAAKKGAANGLHVEASKIPDIQKNMKGNPLPEASDDFDDEVVKVLVGSGEADE
eukprot:gene1123-6745_t